MRAPERQFVEPPWDEPLDVERALTVIPPQAQIAGMFFLGMFEGAKRRGLSLPEPKVRYLAFKFYPIAEFAPLLLKAAELFYPTRSLREGLRAIGTAGPTIFAASMLGKVTIGSAVGVQGTVEAIARTYPINIRPSQCTVSEVKPRSCVVSLDSVPHFLDSHHVGVFEGTLQHAGVKGCVRIAKRGEISADLLLEWA